MNDIAIKAAGLGKKFRIGRSTSSYRTLRDTLSDGLLAPFRRVRGLIGGRASGSAGAREEIWALRDIGFEVEAGEAVGVIGRNGAGKSTLLKVLSRITEPTEGFAEIRGSVSSLLEVGTGFHLELTGRENIYLNGAILGMTRDHIRRRFDEIVDFAEVEKFIDTPVKHYSSGMYLRLAFAVAAHLDPDILIVDEVLAVGDARFHKKCLNKMQDAGQTGRTVIFVSHSMPAITRLCKRAILVEDGRMLADGPSHKVVNQYLNGGCETAASRDWPDPARAPGSDLARLRGVRVITEGGAVTDAVDVSQTFGIEMEFDVLEPRNVLMPYHHVFNQQHIEIFDAHDTDAAWRGRPRPRGRYRSTVWIPGNLLAEGTLFISSGLTRTDAAASRPEFHEQDVISIQVVENIDNERSARGDWSRDMGGVVRPLFRWDTRFIPYSMQVCSL
ncbi:MAG: polysaccharide ABC transporter ATP-binding protein [Nitrospiraceae bacterium]|nr:polysaccharide ABC transporter ATP-binding protein [Nitrospiraceae bacterium]